MIVDVRGREFHFEKPPARVVSLVPSLTETLFDLGAGDSVAGLTNFCMFPPGVVRPRVGGTKNPDTLRMEERVVATVKAFVEAGKPVAAICHAPWVLVEADVVSGKRMTSWPSLRTDLRNAGAEWVDEEVVVDGALMTSRKPDDLPAFCEQMVRLFADAG